LSIPPFSSATWLAFYAAAFALRFFVTFLFPQGESRYLLLRLRSKLFPSRYFLLLLSRGSFLYSVCFSEPDAGRRVGLSAMFSSLILPDQALTTPSFFSPPEKKFRFA